MIHKNQLFLYNESEGDKMNIGKVLNLIAENNIDPEKVFALVEKIKNTDLKNETNLRMIIREASEIAGKEIDQFKEDRLVKKIMQDGINEDLLDMI